MLYRRYPYSIRRNPHFEKNTEQKNSEVQKDVKEIKKIEDFPLPNQSDDFSEEINETSRLHIPSIFNFFRKRIGFEEIIIIGLIFLLIDEGVNDDFLFIILLYILLT